MSTAGETPRQSDAPILCGHPECVLKNPGVDSKYLASNFPTAIMSGYLDHWTGESDRIRMREQCLHCALGVLEGRKTYPTETEWLQLVDLGNWHHRRRRRIARRRH